ncbi:MAG: chemotaxis protein CheW [Planctomycetes bacterium]|nr:chemotaxis protein CheW [Planctomycetota bacterium]
MSALHVVFAVGEVEYAIPVGEVLHMEAFSGATRVPGAAPWVAGVIQTRRQVVPVVDLRARFGLPAAAPTLDTRVIVVRLGDRTIGLLADRAREVLTLGDDQLQAPPEVVTRGAAGFVRQVARAGPRLLMLLDTARVAGEEALRGDER